MEWDVSLVTHHRGQRTESLLLRLPVALARPLIERGMTRATVTLTEEGLLVRPHTSTRPRLRESVELPEGWLE